MDPGLHVKQAINHLDKVIRYAPFVAEDGPDGRTAHVALTPEDWGVVVDALFHMDTPREVFPAELADFAFTDGGRAVLLTLTDGTAVTVDAG